MKYKSLEQLQYWQGQALTSRDFNDQLDWAEQLRWWHNRASHGTFGVGFGLAADLDGTLHCGVAYDCFGRELVVPQDRNMTPVALGAPQYLVLTWDAAGAQLAWIPPDRASTTQGVLLARADSAGKIDLAFHPLQSRALSRPRISSGATPPGNTPWEKIKSASNEVIGLQVRIDTSAAGFTEIPLYCVSLVWTAGRNQRFTPPYVTIADATEDGLTARLLLQGIGQEALDVVSDIKTVSQAEWNNPAPHKVGTLHDDDVVARLVPRINKPDGTATALRIDGPSTPTNKLNLAAAPTSVSLTNPGSVALVNLPRAPSVERSTQEIEVDDASPFAGVTAALRRGGAVAGSAAAIERALPNNRLLFKTPILGLVGSDHIDIVQKTATVDTVDPDNVTITLTGNTTLSAGDILVRLSNTMESEVPVEVLSVPVPKKKIIVLKAPIPSLLHGEFLGVAKPGAAVSAFVDIVTTTEVEQFRERDVLRAVDGSMAIIKGIDGNVLLLDSPLTVAAGGGTVSIGDYGAKSTVSETPADDKSVKVRNPALFAIGDVVALVKGTAGQVAAVISKVTGTSGGALALDKPLTGAQAGHVVAVVRFSASSSITSIAPLTVVDSTNFRKGDLVAMMNNPTLACGEISEIQAGGVLVLKDKAPALVKDATLGVVFIKTVAAISDLSNTAPFFIATDSSIARKGWYAAHVDRWMDATDPVVLKVTLPDGTLPGDSIGLAALTLSQPVIRFASTAEVAAFEVLFLQGADEVTRVPRQVTAIVLPPISDSNQANLFLFATGFTLRPEEMSAVAGFSPTLADDFAAYAQLQGLSLCWVGCQIPPAQPPDCPGIPDDGPCSCQ